MTSLRPAHSRQARGEHLHAPALRLSVARVHAEDLLGKQRGFITARAGADFQHHVLLVVGIPGQEQESQFLFHLLLALLEFEEFLMRHRFHFRVGRRLVHQRFRILHRLVDRLPLLKFLDNLRKVRARLGRFLIELGSASTSGLPSCSVSPSYFASISASLSK